MVAKDPEIDYFQLIETTIATLGDHFEADELAYLALTAKIESAIRDKLGYCLYKSEALRPLVVAREWKDIDLAILPSNQEGDFIANVGLQLKVKSSSYKIVKEADRVGKDARADLNKCQNKSERAYTLLVAPHIEHDSVPGFFKYGWYPVKSAEVNDAVTSQLKGWTIVGSNYGRKIDAGEAFETRVSILYWLCNHVK